MSEAPTRAIAAAPLAVLGLGGIGGMIAARTGALCVGTERTVEAIRVHGLTLVDGGRTTVSRPEAMGRLDRRVTLLVVAVKAHDLDAALARLDPAGLDGTLVLPLLNGLEHVDRLRARLAELRGDAPHGQPRVAAGIIGGVEAFSPEPGVVVQRTQGATVTAASRETGREGLLAALAPLRVPGIDVVVADDELDVLWDKVARLAVLAAATVASGAPVGELRADDRWRARLGEALAEACAVAAADGVDVEPAGQWAIIEAMAPDLTTSTARDAAAGRPTELDAITGAVVRAGRRLGVATPALERLLADAHARSAGSA